MMKAAVLHKNGDPTTTEVISVVDETEVPTPGEGEILVKVSAAAIVSSHHAAQQRTTLFNTVSPDLTLDVVIAAEPNRLQNVARRIPRQK